MLTLNDRLAQLGARSAVYRYHTDQALGDESRLTAWAKHYTGRTADMDRRDDEHRAGRGARILKAAVERGIPFHLETVYACASEGVAENLEIWLKARSHAREFCAHCAALRAGELPPAAPTIVWVERVEDVMRARPRRPLAAIRDRLIGRWSARADERAEEDLPPPPPTNPPGYTPFRRHLPERGTISESEARRRGWYVPVRVPILEGTGDYPIDPVSEEEWQQIRRDRRHG